MRAIAFARDDADGQPPRGVEWTPLAPPASGRSWRARAERRTAMAAALRRLLADRRADVVAGQLHTGPVAIDAARQFGAAGVLFVPSYEALCHWAFGTGSECHPESRCRDCPRALSLGPPERRALWAARAAQERALRSASLLVAPSRAMADVFERACGRRPLVAAPVAAAPAPARARIDGHVAAMSSVWTPDKGALMLAPIAALVPDRGVLIQVPPAGIRADVAAELDRLPNVTLRPPPGEISDVLDGAAALIVPSQLDEPFGRVAFEGLAAGVPTLASDAGGLRETVPAGQRVTPRDGPGAWATAIRRLEDPRAWQRARDAGVAAAGRVLSERPLERIEDALLAAARDRRAAAA
ncbi:MAG: hypothetical protein QOK25_1964 [Thermoleophilaceae bacterium]|nr:hypothetical protein [Thermoleophilaceae bacterium]